MAGITMCQGIGCDMRNSCYRYRAVPDCRRQSWANFQHSKEGCQSFLTIYHGGRVMPLDWQEDK